jgi:hypothetical protein
MRTILSQSLIALSLVGCMSGEDYAERAVEHNRAIAGAADQLVLLNIVRAKLDRPVIYSQFNGVNESFSNNAGASLGVPFGPAASPAYSASFNAGPNQYASLSTNPLDDVQYYQGVMRPVQLGQLRYYLDNGWPMDLLMALAVEKLEVGIAFYRRIVAESDALCAGRNDAACARIASTNGAVPTPAGEILVFTNDPRNPAAFDAFHNLALRMIVLGLTIDGTYVKSTASFPATIPVYADANLLERMSTGAANFKRNGDNYVMTTWSWVPGLRLTRLGNTKLRIEGDTTSADAIPDMTASLRSPDSIMFYLGAYVREGGADANVLIGDGFVPVFELGSCDDAIIKVDFDGQCYGVPQGGSHVSMKVMAFLHQIFGLNKRASEPPVSGAVRVVN